MAALLANPTLRYALAALLIAVAVALQFVPLYKAELEALAGRYPIVRVLRSRLFQLGAGFALLTLGIELLRFE
ncbi:MAG: hypothetical protein ACU85V_05225 [Gammaproteobacteria bacterium]